MLVCEELDGWYRGCRDEEPGVMGIFPKAFVVIRESEIVSSCNPDG